jgi:hypothetical protein
MFLSPGERKQETGGIPIQVEFGIREDKRFPFSIEFLKEKPSLFSFSILSEISS